MSLVTVISSPAPAPAAPDLDAADPAGHREARPSRISALLEALAYAGAAFDPAAALAARRYARLRDEEQRHDRW
jgi:hypothetical protein